MVKVKVDISPIKNEINVIYDEAYKGLNATSDTQRRDILNRLIEKLRTLKSRLAEVE